MNGSSDRNLSKGAFWHGMAVLAVVAVLVVQGVQGESGDGVVTNVRLQQPMPPTNAGGKDGQAVEPDALNLASTGLSITRPVFCCLPSIPGRDRGLCRLVSTGAACVESNGRPVSNCTCCYWDGCVAPTDEDAEDYDATQEADAPTN